MTLPVAILAGGLATRLQPISATIPKSIVDVAGEPFIVRQLRSLRESGIRRVVLCTGHFGDQVEDVVGNGAAFDLTVTYSRDGEQPLGTGGALMRALPQLGDAFFVLYGDSFLPVDYGAVARAHTQGGRPGLMTVLRNDDEWDRSNATYENGVVVAYDKRTPTPAMRHIDYGLSVLTPQVFSTAAPATPFDLADLYHYLAAHGLLAGHEVFDRFYEIGSLAGLQETIQYFQRSEGDDVHGAAPP